MALMAAGSPLVSGEQVKPDVKMTTVKVLRGFMYEGKPVPPGTVRAFPSYLVLELLSIQRAELWVEPPPPAPAPLKMEGALTVADDTSTKSKGGRRHAEQ